MLSGYDCSMSRVRIPSDLNEEDVFFSAGPVKLSIRQLTVLAASAAVWYCVAKVFLVGLLGITTLFALIACSWILIIGVALAFAKIGHRPLDVWIGDKISFVMSARTYTMREEDAYGDLDANLEEDHDIQALLEHRQHNRGH